MPDGHIIRHVKCRNPVCCNPSHLLNGTHKDNADDRERDGTTARGAKSLAGKATKLNPEKVREIRKLYEETHLSHRELGSMFGVSASAIGFAVTRSRWAHVE